LHQVGVSFDLYYDARKHKIKMHRTIQPVLKLQLPLALSVTISLKIKHEGTELLRHVSIRFNQNL
jgi:hypothetical protein